MSFCNLHKLELSWQSVTLHGVSGINVENGDTPEPFNQDFII